MPQSNQTVQIIKAFKSAVDSYVPSHNKNSWNSDGSDKIAQLINDSVRFNVSSFNEIADNLGVTMDQVQNWALGIDVPKSRVRYSIKNFLSQRCNAAMHTN